MTTQGPLRIAMGLHSLALGGSQINTIDLAAALRGRGHDVVVFAIDDGIGYRATIHQVAEGAGIPIEVLPGRDRFSAQAGEIAHLVDRHEPHVVHVNHEGHMVGPLAAVGMRGRPGRALVVTNWIMENSAWLPRHAPLIVGTEALRREAADRHRARVWLLEPPVNLARDRMDDQQARAFRQAHGLDDDDVVGVLVSRVDHSMKLDSMRQALRATVLVDDRRLRLVIVGDGDAADVVRAHAEEVNDRLQRRAVMLTGALADPRPAYSAADFVLGMGGSALRGLAFSKPVIVQGTGTFARTFTDATMDYFMEHGFFGHCEGAGSGEPLAAQIRPLMDAAVRSELGELGARVVRTRFSLQTATSTLEEIYRDALRNLPSWGARQADAAYVLGGYAGVRWLPTGIYDKLRPAVRAVTLGRRQAS